MYFKSYHLMRSQFKGHNSGKAFHSSLAGAICHEILKGHCLRYAVDIYFRHALASLDHTLSNDIWKDV